ncbi:MAG: DsbA family protein [Acidobacteriia bacterium]|nr:DsbA family protein [Terriglobia bacterium]
MRKAYGDKVRVVWKNYPLDMHKDSPLAHLAAAAAADQGKFWEYHDKLFGNPGQLKRDQLLKYASELGLNVPRFQEAMDTARFRSRIDADTAEARTLGVTGTPAFFVNGRFLSGAKPFEEFKKVIDAELTRLHQPIPPA